MLGEDSSRMRLRRTNSTSRKIDYHHPCVFFSEEYLQNLSKIQNCGLWMDPGIVSYPVFFRIWSGSLRFQTGSAYNITYLPRLSNSLNHNWNFFETYKENRLELPEVEKEHSLYHAIKNYYIFSTQRHIFLRFGSVLSLKEAATK